MDKDVNNEQYNYLIKMMEGVGIDSVYYVNSHVWSEINARFYCFVENIEYLGFITTEQNIDLYSIYGYMNGSHICNSPNYADAEAFLSNHENAVFYPSLEKYVPIKEHSTVYADKYNIRSRDALKASRNWEIRFLHPTIRKDLKWGYSASDQHGFFETPFLPTEELAEAHLIIQAIQSGRIKRQSVGEG